MSAISVDPASLPSVQAALNYVAPMTEKPFNYTYGPPPGMPRTNAVQDPRTVAIHSLRPVERELSLDGEGFAIAHHKSAVADFYDEDELTRVYYPEIEALVMSQTGARRVKVFDHTVRRREWDTQDRVPGVARGPVMRVHNDFTEWSGPQRVRDLMGGEADSLLRRRVAFINVWRPIRGPLLDHPLAVCDARSTNPEDFVGSEQRYEDRNGEIYIVRYNPAHRWFYAPAMRKDEAMLIKCYDSDRTVARFVAHSAFDDPTMQADAPPRESIEIRTIAFFA
ncbi:MAG TPA: CmcJ/NvfI family oxidoreductase [Stellaceae bacterium]|nr:CmcJ/NvfI family oxidoreductase [Stellaceae bacterium]